MKWIGRRQSDNLEDRRGMSGGGKAVVGGGLIGVVILLLQVLYQFDPNYNQVNSNKNNMHSCKHILQHVY